ncbi:hypothetical protein FOD75_11060 (plasmid) [Limosilactobacillus reuteri]|uniref:Thioredoxin n=1 Tax=Limosilactobacillus reuteri TaxID=1598 RepID=A0A517D8F1_LIMRT|nr:hypothetical protein [Limosilactobacillus reuteri]QDR73628.1 hypothetical protein FOD75_11060 [Limosilactobacillus reuteri]
MKKVIKSVLLSIAVIVLGFAIKLGIEFIYSPVDQAMQSEDSFVMYYRWRCKRCHHTWAWMWPRMLFSLKRDYFINANDIPQYDLYKYHLHVTPGFKQENKVIQTVNKAEIKKIWNETH